MQPGAGRDNPIYAVNFTLALSMVLLCFDMASSLPITLHCTALLLILVPLHSACLDRGGLVPIGDRERCLPEFIANKIV